MKTFLNTAYERWYLLKRAEARRAAAAAAAASQQQSGAAGTYGGVLALYTGNL